MQRLVVSATLGIAALFGAACAPAQEPPVPRLVRIVVPFSAGASNDAIARGAFPAASLTQNDAITSSGRRPGTSARSAPW